MSIESGSPKKISGLPPRGRLANAIRADCGSSSSGEIPQEYEAFKSLLRRVVKPEPKSSLAPVSVSQKA